MKLIDPMTFSPHPNTTDWEKLNWAFQQAAKHPGSTIDCRSVLLDGSDQIKKHWQIDRPLIAEPYGKADRLEFDIIGCGPKTIVYKGDPYQAAVNLLNWKGSCMTNFGIEAEKSIIFRSNNSSGMNTVERCAFEGEVLWLDLLTPPNGADISNWDVVLCSAKTFRIVGSNALGPWQFRQCGGIDGDYAFDLSKGGHGVEFASCGGVRCKKAIFRLRGGYSHHIHGGRSEDCHSLAEFGGPDADGDAQPHAVTIMNRSDEAVKGPYLVLRKSGIVVLSGCHVSGSNLIETHNESETTPLIVYAPDCTIHNTGSGDTVFNGQPVVQQA